MRRPPKNPNEEPASTPRRVYLETFGCQMNELDSELVKGHLHSLGYEFVNDDTAADVVLYNTCSVREQAENKALSRVGLITQRKRAGESIVLGVLGCMAERDGLPMLQRHPEIDLLCGPGELDKLPMLLDNVLRARHSERAQANETRSGRLPMEERVALAGSRSRRSAVLGAAEDSLEVLDLSRSFDPAGGAKAGGHSAYVRITRGCNKFCTYCVVPHTRGAEVHRPPADIVAECRQLAELGVIEITLLGQTVNHYRYTHGSALSVGGKELPQVGPGLTAFRGSATATTSAGSKTTSFADLLKLIHDEVPEIQRLRFVTSYPRDFSDDALAVIAESPRICPYLHVPAQSGSNRVLKLMNRGYTVEEYLEFIARAQRIIPGVSIAGDIIVGFPGETDADFEATVDLVRAVPFKNNFIFKYSPRPGTVAITRFEDDVPEEVKRQRNNLLLAVQSEVSTEVHARWRGQTVDVLVEQISKRDQKASAKADRLHGRVPLTTAGQPLPDRPANQPEGSDNTVVPSPNRLESTISTQMSGRTDGDLITFFDSPRGLDAEDLIGSIVSVHVHESSALSLSGVLQTP